jgi:hypothetical protein
MAKCYGSCFGLHRKRDMVSMESVQSFTKRWRQHFKASVGRVEQ